MLSVFQTKKRCDPDFKGLHTIVLTAGDTAVFSDEIFGFLAKYSVEKLRHGVPHMNDRIGIEKLKVCQQVEETLGYSEGKVNKMGATHVTVTIRNPADPDRSWEELFLVDTGATDSLVPRPHLESIGLKPKGQRVYELADGRQIKMEITTADIEFMGEIVGGTILFGEANAEPLLGLTA